MIYFSLRGDVEESIIIKDDKGNPKITIPVIPTSSETVDENQIFVGSIFEVRQIGLLLSTKYGKKIRIQFFDDEVIEDSFNLPIKVGRHLGSNNKISGLTLNEALVELENKDNKTIRILVNNMFGYSHIDSLYSANVQRAVTNQIVNAGYNTKYQGTVSWNFPQPADLGIKIHPMNIYVNNIYPLKMLLGFDMHFSMADLENYNDYGKVDMSEFFCNSAGLESEYLEIGYEIDKVKQIQISNSINKHMSLYSKMVLVQTEGAFLINTIPHEMSLDFLEGLALSEPSSLFVTNINGASKLDNIVNLSELITGVSDYIYLLTKCDAIVSAYSLASHIGYLNQIPTIIINSTDSSSQFAENEFTKIVPILEHEFSKVQSQFFQPSVEQEKEIWSKFDLTEIVSLFKNLPSKKATCKLKILEQRKHFLATVNGN